MEKKIHPEVCSKSIIANNSTNTTTSSLQNPRYLWKLLSFEFCKTLGYAYFSMIKSFSQDQFRVCMSLRSKLIWLSGCTAWELLWKGQNSSAEPSSSPAVCFYWWRWKTWDPAPHWSATILQALRLAFLCNKTCSTSSIFSDTAEKCSSGKSWVGIAASHLRNTGTDRSPLLSQEAHGVWALKPRSFTSQKSQHFPLLQVDKLKMIKSKTLNIPIPNT